MIEQLIQYLKDGEEYEAASLLADCSLNYLYVDTLFEINGDGMHDMFDVNIEAPRKVIKQVNESSSLKQQIESAIRGLAETSSEHIRYIFWVPKLVSSARTPAEGQISDVLSQIDSEHIHKAWDKALSRKNSDPEGAITAARTLIETICKHILDKAQIAYPDDADLPKLYYLTAKHLQLAPSQYSNRVLRQVLGNCQAIVSGLTSIRNELGDAHGKSKGEISPEPIHAELAVNLAGTMAMFLVSIWEKSVNKK
jgi:hypothetical protein